MIVFLAYKLNPFSECVCVFDIDISGRYLSFISLGIKCLMQFLEFILFVAVV